MTDIPLALSQFSWENEAPVGHTLCFKLTAGTLKFELGYVMYKAGVLLLCTEKIGEQSATLWRRHWVSKEAAVRSAENLITETGDYIDMLGLRERPYEDLDVDDFLEHLRLNVAGLFH